MIETYEQKKRRIMGKQFLIRYTNSLNEILINKISSGTLLSIVETDCFYSRIDCEKKPRIKKTILFSARKDVMKILKAHSIDFNDTYVLWIKDSDYCGAFKLESLNYFNFEFPYDVSRNGIIVLTQIDYKYKILLDFYEENNVKYLDVEVFYEIKKEEN